MRRQRTLELAELYDARLERPYEAIDTYERFVGSVDEDERGADDPQVVRENADALEALARLYARVGMWPKAVEALQRQIELGPEPERAAHPALRLAEICERELGQADQAVAASSRSSRARRAIWRRWRRSIACWRRRGATRRCRRSSPAGRSWLRERASAR